jgi:hypothetical protein
MYISRLVKTRSPHSGLLINCNPGSSISLAATLYFPSSPSSSFHLFPYSLSHLNLLSIHLGGSATTPSHIQSGPSVTIPSVQEPKLSCQ